MYRDSSNRKRIVDSDDSSDSNEIEEPKTTKTVDERDSLVEAFTKLLWDVQNKTSSLKPIYEDSIKQMFNDHCVGSDVPVIQHFIKQYSDIVDIAVLKKGFTSAVNNNRLETVKYFYATYGD